MSQNVYQGSGEYAPPIGRSQLILSTTVSGDAKVVLPTGVHIISVYSAGSDKYYMMSNSHENLERAVGSPFVKIVRSTSETTLIGARVPGVPTVGTLTYATSLSLMSGTNSIVYGNGLFLCTGTGNGSGLYWVSTDGINWSVYSNGSTANAWSYLTYGNGLYLMGGRTTSAATLITSTDLTNWVTRTTGLTSAIYCVGYGNGLYLAGTISGQLAYSTDSVTWTTVAAPVATYVNSILYGNGIYLAAFDNGSVAVSTNGASWTANTVATGASKSVAYGAGVFVAAGGTSAIYTSTNGTTWVNTATHSTRFTSVTYGNGLFTAASENGFRVSTDGLTWSSAITTTYAGRIAAGKDGIVYTYGYSASPYLNSYSKNPISVKVYSLVR